MLGCVESLKIGHNKGNVGSGVHSRTFLKTAPKTTVDIYTVLTVNKKSAKKCKQKFYEDICASSVKINYV